MLKKQINYYQTELNLTCSNCGEKINEMNNIPKGTTKDFYIMHKRCENCGCNCLELNGE